ncbi:MAG: hypothetical protein R8G66_00960 [Cytophagales bacterium]|nr:hypothetical protein [Cytophagales bacterium]
MNKIIALWAFRSFELSRIDDSALVGILFTTIDNYGRIASIYNR